MSSCDHLQLKEKANFTAAIVTVGHALHGTHLSVWLTTDEIDAKLWAAAIAVLCGVLE
jgi:hypothetical protein